MPTYQYTGTEPRYYPGLGLHARPADDHGPATVAEFDDRPPAAAGGDEQPVQVEGARRVPDDGRWTPSKKKPTPPPAVPATVPDSQAGDGQKEA